MRSRILIVGRDKLVRNKSRLHFVLITHDLWESSRSEILSEFAHYPVVAHYTAGELESFFGIKGAKVIGFAKPGLARSLYAELKARRITDRWRPRREARRPIANETRRYGDLLWRAKGEAPSGSLTLFD